jgi:methylthioribose-1-phosphate isomerase
MSNKQFILIYGQFGEDFFRSLKARKDIGGILVLEGRPFLEGAKEVCKKILQHRLKPTLLCDNMAGFCFYRGMVKEVHLAFQQIKGKNALCKIGSLGLSVAAKYHGVPVYAHPAAKKLKASCKPKDIFYFAGQRIAPAGIKAYTSLIEEVPLKYLTKVRQNGK